MNAGTETTINLTQLAILFHSMSGFNNTAADYFQAAAMGEDGAETIREAKRVRDFCHKVQRTAPAILGGENAAAICAEAEEVAGRMSDHIRKMEAITE